MRVAIVTNFLSTNGGGLSSVTKGQLEGFLDININAHVFGVSDELWPTQKCNWPKGYTTTFSNSPLSLFKMAKEITSWRPDVIHINGLWSFHILASYIAAKILQIPYFIAPHGSLNIQALSYSKTKKSIANFFYHERCLKSASALFASHSNEHEDFITYGITNPIKIIGNGIDTSLIKEKKPYPKDSRRFILSLGRLHKIKGLDLLIKAWSKVEADFPNWDLIIAGPDSYGYYNNELKKLVEELNINQIKFIGPVYSDKKFKIYQDASIFVLTSLSEGFALTILESLISSTPVIATQTTPWEAINEIGCGWWIPIDELETTLRTAMSTSPKTLLEKGQKGNKWAKENFLWPKIAEQLIKTYKDIEKKK